MENKIYIIFKATINKLIVAFLIIISVLIFYRISFKEKFETVADLINVFAVTETKEGKPVLNGIELKNKPVYGSKYGTLKIPSIELELPIYFGDSLSILKSGIGHDSNSYFHGEGGTILYMGHNYKTFLAKLPDVQKGDKIEVETDYGKFKYKVYKSKVVNEYDISQAPIQDEEEMLIIYTCWPINNIGHADERYLVYAK